MGIHRGKWQAHLKAAEASGLSLAGYAAKHDINVRRLYEARRQRPKAQTAFVRVKVKSPVAAGAGAASRVHGAGAGGALAMQARLGNGVVLHWMHQASAEQALVSLLRTLAGLACSV